MSVAAPPIARNGGAGLVRPLPAYAAIAVVVSLLGGLLLTASHPALSLVPLGLAAFIGLTHRVRRPVVRGLTVWMVFLFLLPQRFVVPGLGAAGTPATLLALSFGLTWLLARPLTPALGLRHNTPTMPVMVAFAVVVVGTSAGARAFGHLDDIETRAMIRAVLLMIAWVLTGVLIAVGVASRGELERLLKVLTLCCAGVALWALFEFITGIDFFGHLHIPGFNLSGLETNKGFIHSRIGAGSLRRVSGTTVHPIEFACLDVVGLFLALHFAKWAAPGDRRRWWAIVGVLALAVPLSVSRTALVGVIVGALVLVPSWSRRMRKRSLIVVIVSLPLIRLAAPGLLGTIGNLVTNGATGTDSSIQHRTQDYTSVWAEFGRAPFFGRGFGTWLSNDHHLLLDNQLLKGLLEFGIVGDVLLISVVVAGIRAARRVRRVSRDARTKDLATTLVAGTAAMLVSLAFFDALNDHMFSALLFIMVGCSGALLRLERTMPAAASPVRAQAVPAGTPERTGVLV